MYDQGGTDDVAASALMTHATQAGPHCFAACWLVPMNDSNPISAKGTEMNTPFLYRNN